MKGTPKAVAKAVKKNIDWNDERFNEILPRCTVCKHHVKHMDDGKSLHYCLAAFNNGDLIYRETTDQCTDLDAFEEKQK